MPIPSVVQHVKDLYEQGATLYCWSSGGAEYARQSAHEFGIEYLCALCSLAENSLSRSCVSLVYSSVASESGNQGDKC
jgi:phosphoserine phosphatase